MTLVLGDRPSDLDHEADDDVKPIDQRVNSGGIDAGDVLDGLDGLDDDRDVEADDIDDIDDDDDDDFEHDENLVRAFTLTGGRTQNTEVAVAIQSVVCQSQASLEAAPTLAPVENEIWRAAGDRLSSAEISYRLELPLGVVRVLVGDLVTAGLVTVGKTTATGNAQLVRRLIDGVRSL